MNDIELVAALLELGDDDAFAVVRLCDLADRELAIEQHGYPRDLPAGRDLAGRLADASYVARLARLGEDEGASTAVLAALAHVAATG